MIIKVYFVYFLTKKTFNNNPGKYISFLTDSHWWGKTVVRFLTPIP